MKLGGKGLTEGGSRDLVHDDEDGDREGEEEEEEEENDREGDVEEAESDEGKEEEDTGAEEHGVVFKDSCIGDGLLLSLLDRR